MSFSYKGFAIAASGQFTCPFNERIDVVAATALPQSGGYGSAEAVNFNFRNLIRFERAHSYVVGSSGNCCDDGDGSNTTLLQSTVEGLEIFGVLSADSVTARLMTTYKKDAIEPDVHIVGTSFQNLKIAGRYIDSAVPTDILDRYPTYTAITEAHGKGDADVTRFFSKSGKFVNRASLLSEVIVPGLGTVRLVDVQITPLTRIVNMVQIDFNCPWKGHFMCCLAEDGGSPS